MNEADKVVEKLLQAKLPLAKIGYEAWRLETNTATKWDQLSSADKRGWARAALRIEAELSLKSKL